MAKNVELEQLVINKLTQEQYNKIASKNPNELYFITDANPVEDIESKITNLENKVIPQNNDTAAFPEATAENEGAMVIYTGETMETPWVEHEDGSVDTVFLDNYITQGHTFMLVPVQLAISETETVTIYMWKDVTGAIPPFTEEDAGKILSTNGITYEWVEESDPVIFRDWSK